MISGFFFKFHAKVGIFVFLKSKKSYNGSKCNSCHYDTKYACIPQAQSSIKKY